MKEFYDIVIVGSGAAGLSCALKLNPDYDICLISKKSMTEANSYLAQGGISAKLAHENLDDYIEDTLKAGHYENDVDVVRAILDESLDVVEELIGYGVNFDKLDPDTYSLHKEGGHRSARVYHVGDFTGRSMCEVMAERVKARPNIDTCENTVFYDLIIEDNKTVGIRVFVDGLYKNIYARAVVLATGGIGGIFNSSTNYKSVSGEALSIAMKYGVEVSNLEYIQIHPTVLYDKAMGRHSLITEALRGEGGILLGINGDRFVDELLPRDVVSKAIRNKMEEDQTDHVYLSLENIRDRERIDERFPTVFQACMDKGIDIRKDMIPVCPGQHYHMGGIKAQIDGRTNLPGLYAIGETSCTGLHGRNRLASNSLLEACFCGMKCGEGLNASLPDFKAHMEENRETRNIDDIIADYHKILVDTIKERNHDFYEYWLKNEDA